MPKRVHSFCFIDAIELDLRLHLSQCLLSTSPLSPRIIVLNVNESDPRSDVHYLGSSENKA